MLAGDADRERAVNVLKEAFTEGRLKQDEYEERIGDAYQARTYADLDRLTEDIPHPMPLTFQPVPPPVPPYSRYPRYPPPGPYGPVPPRTDNGNATAALVCGLLTPVTLGVTSIPAIILGHAAKRQIRATGQAGEGKATAGLVLGYLVAVGWLLVIVSAVLSGG
jgi:hypothetical protein